MLVCNAYIWAFLVRIYMRVCKKMVIYLGIKTPQSRKERKYTWQKNARISCSRNDCKYTWEKTARMSYHNFQTNGRPENTSTSANEFNTSRHSLVTDMNKAQSFIYTGFCTEVFIRRNSQPCYRHPCWKNQDLATEPTHTHTKMSKFYKTFSGGERSRTPSQLSHPG